jgi:hypothetical protein
VAKILDIFKSYRARQLGRVGTIDDSPIKLKVIGHAGTESKWLDITPTELEAIIAVLEPKDYESAVEPAIRVKLPDFGDVTETVGVYYLVKSDGTRSVPFSAYSEADDARVHEQGVWDDVEPLQFTVRYNRHDMDFKAKKWVQEQGNTTQHWSTFDVWEFIKEHYSGGRSKFLIDNE